MAYRKSKNPITGNPEIVIDGFENGIADSPYLGIANMRNLGTVYYPGVAYVNYKRLAATISGGSMKKPQFYCTSPAGLIYVIDSTGQVWKQSTANSSTFNLLGSSPTTGASGQGIAFWQNYLFVFRGAFIDICGDGTGDSGVTSSNWNNSATPHNAVWPIGSPTNVTLTGSLSAGAVSAILSSYNDTNGAAQTTWVLPTGTYQMTLSNTQKVSATLTFGSATINFSPAVADGGASSSVTITPIFSTQNGSSVNHMSIVSGNDGNLYFCNGQFVGSLSVPSGNTFNLGIPASYRFNYSALGLPQYETAVWLDELIGNLIVSGVKKMYPWDRTSTSWQNPVPIPENISKTVNILNKLYVLAGQKGNVYISNGYSASLLRKLPDSITSQGGSSGTGTPLVDPTWTWGGIMSHRCKLFFQAFAQNSVTADGVLAGIFSIDTDTGALNFENQNSFGIVSSTTSGTGILIDNSPSSGGNDSYYSGWSNGISNAGGIDYNTTTLYSSYEPIIETDLINVGSFLNNKTFNNIEFKLDQPMLSGDSIRVSGRQSLSDSYTVLGTTSTTVLSNVVTPLSLQNFQWIQLKVELSCNSSAGSSSFTRIREIIIR